MKSRTWSLPLLLAVAFTCGTVLLALHLSKTAHPAHPVAYAATETEAAGYPYSLSDIDAADAAADATNDIQYQTVITVTSTSDEDTHKSHTCYTTPGVGQTAFPAECTLRRAIVEASSIDPTARPVLISFNIPLTDTGYSGQTWHITLTQNLSVADFSIAGGNVTIDGTTQPGGRPLSEGPRIFIRAPAGATAASPDLRLNMGRQTSHDGYIVRGLGLQGLGIGMTGSNNLIEGNWLGLTDDGSEVWFYHDKSFGDLLYGEGGPDDSFYFEGTATLGNGAEIVEGEDSQNNVIANNVLAGTKGRAITVRGTGARLLNNYVGTRADGTIPDVSMNRRCQGNALYYNWFGGMAIQLTESSSGALVQGNVILGTGIPSFGEASALEAISVRGNNHVVASNRIGMDAQGNDAWICGQGLDLGGQNQQIRNNTLVNTYGGAMGIYGTELSLDAIHLSGNTMRNSYLTKTNPVFGSLVPDAYKLFNSAVVTSVVGTTVMGTAVEDSACGGCSIELFVDNLDDHIEALEPVGMATAAPDGTWTTTLSRTLTMSEALRTATTTVSDAQIAGIAAPTTAKLSPLYGPDGMIDPTPREEPSDMVPPPPAIPQIEPRPVPPLPSPTYTMSVTVNSTDDPSASKSETCITHSPCTLRRAINQVNNDTTARPALIRFNIPTTDTNYITATESWLITLVSNEQIRVEGGQVTIDGTTQPGERANGGPQIFLRDPDPTYEIVLDGGHNVFRGFGMQNVGILVNGGYNIVQDNWSGLEADGQTLSNEGLHDTAISDSTNTNGPDNVYRNNVIAGSTSRPLTIRGHRAWVVGNYIGTRADGTLPPDLPSDWCEQSGDTTWYGGFGIKITGHDHQIGGPNREDQNVIVGMNIESDTSDPPEALFIEGGDGHLILNNLIGQDTNGKNWGNCGKSIRIRGDSVAIRDNLIVNSYLSAIAQDEDGGNLYRNNTLIDNWAAIVFNPNTVSDELRSFNPAKVTEIDGTTVRGTSGDVFVHPSTGNVYDPFCPHCTIELFRDDQDSTTDALEQLAVVTSDGDGNWQATLPAPLQDGQGIRTTSTTGNYGTIPGFEANTTTKLSRLYAPGGVVGVEISGPTQGAPNTDYTFTATITTTGEPAYPITVTWKKTPARIYTHVLTDTTSDQITFSWESISEQDFSVFAENIGGEAMDTHHISVGSGPDMPSVQFSSATYSTTEQLGTATITATLSTTPTQEVTVQYATTEGGTAMPGSDYAVISGTLTFTPGMTTTQTFTVTVINDDEHEGDETVNLALSNPTGANLGSQSQAVLTIGDDEGAPTAPEGVDISPTAGTVNAPVSFEATVRPYTATTPLTYTWMAQGQETKQTTNGGPTDTQEFIWDATGTYTLTVVASNQFGTITETISVDIIELTVQFSESSYSVNESIGTAIITVTLNTVPDQQVSVDYAMEDGSATAGEDYDATSGTLTFVPVETEQNLVISITNDGENEDDETFTITLSNPQNVALGENDTLTLTILDDDQDAGRLDVNYETGAPGSIFIFTAINLPPNASAVISLKKPGDADYQNLQQVTTLSDGTLVFALVVTENAAEGQYSIRITINEGTAEEVVLTNNIEISATGEMRTDTPPDGTPIIELETGNMLYLPIIKR
jgi:hypothetical protein